MPAGIPYEEARKRYHPGVAPAVRGDDISVEALLKAYHPDHGPNARVALAVGVNRGEPCQPDLARYLQANALIDDVDIAGAQLVSTDVLIIGGGGGGCAAALTAARQGAQVILATKLRLGDSNTVMAEGGIQAAIGEDDSPQLHFEDTLRAGHFCGEPELVAQMVMDGPDVIRWLIRLGMTFDQEEDRPLGGNLLRKKPGGASAARILSYRDYTGLEMMRVLREAVDLEPGIAVWNRCPAVELLSDERGQCAGAVIYNLEWRTFVLVRARAVILATGGAGRLHLNAFPTSNHYGATADGLVLAYRIGARLRELDSFQYHPTGIAYPPHLAGGLISEAARSAGAKLINGEGERFVDELKPRDIVASAILRECAQGRGIERGGQVGVFLDTPTLEMENPGILAKRLVTLRHLADKCGQDPAQEPFLVYPTLHYQNGGVAIDKEGATSVPGLYCVGEVTGGIHGRNRLMGNALLDILSMGRRAGASAAQAGRSVMAARAGIGHVHAWQRELTLAGLPLHVKAPQLFPGYANFDLRVDAGLRTGAWGGRSAAPGKRGTERAMEQLNQVLLNEDIRVGADLDAWLARGGGEGLARALREPAAVIAEIEQADLRGMGGAGFATHRKWAPVAAAAAGDKYIICNGNEDEPGTFKDRFLLEHTPHQVIEGALIAAAATRANHVVLYVNPHQPLSLARTREAVQQWQAHPQFAELAGLVGGPVSLRVLPSSGLYIGGEETAVIASVEGGFPFPRRKPPFPAEHGVHGAPTVVNNTETLAHVPGILRNGAQWYRGLGIGHAAGTKLYSLSGDVLRPGLYELPMGTSLETLVFRHGGGMLQGKEFKAVFTGGPSNTLLTKRDLDVALDFDSVRQRRSRLGTGAMIVVSEGTSIVRKVAEYVSFFAQGSCGQCPPCKGGTFQLMRLLNRIDTGRGVRADLESLENLCRILPGSGRCGLIDGAVTVVDSSLHQFREEYEALLMA